MSSETANIVNEVKKVIHGKDKIIEMTLAAILAGGHVLLEDIPGVGKTTMATAFAKALSLDYKRVQFTPDVLPSDLVGFNMYNKENGTFSFVPGSVYTNFFLADEINRTSPKTQSALLEVMEEKKATVEGTTRNLPYPFFVLATQNPFGSSGTQRLPESQLDRFMICLSIGYPDTQSAIEILKGDSSKDISNIISIIDAQKLYELQNFVSNIYVSDEVYQYIVAITEGTRNREFFDLGLSPRGSIALLKMAKANAFVNGRDFVSPGDVTSVLCPVSIHRVKLSGKAKASGLTVENALLNVLSGISAPGTHYAN